MDNAPGQQTEDVAGRIDITSQYRVIGNLFDPNSDSDIPELVSLYDLDRGEAVFVNTTGYDDAIQNEIAQLSTGNLAQATVTNGGDRNEYWDFVDLSVVDTSTWLWYTMSRGYVPSHDESLQFTTPVDDPDGQLADIWQQAPADLSRWTVYNLLDRFGVQPSTAAGGESVAFPADRLWEDRFKETCDDCGSTEFAQYYDGAFMQCRNCESVYDVQTVYAGRTNRPTDQQYEIQLQREQSIVPDDAQSGSEESLVEYDVYEALQNGELVVEWFFNPDYATELVSDEQREQLGAKYLDTVNYMIVHNPVPKEYILYYLFPKQNTAFQTITSLLGAYLNSNA